MYRANYQLNYNSNQIKGFQKGEVYRVGIQFQDTKGKWSEVVFVGDYECTERNESHNSLNQFILYASAINVTVNDVATVQAIKDLGYIKARGVVCFPDFNDRNVICQGILCPTVANYKDRLDNSPFAQSSWFTRPFMPDDSWVNEYGTMAHDCSKGEVPYFYHNGPIGSASVNDLTRSEIQTALGVVPYIPTGTDPGEYTDKSMSEFLVDHNIVTMHSPEVEFNDNLQNLVNADYKLRIIGAVALNNTLSDISLTTSTPTLGLKSLGFFKGKVCNTRMWNYSVTGEGGSHEENPLSGVPMGLAPDGQPNLVEEGEVVFNDYVFSNRLHPTEKMLKQYNIPLKYKDHTFASIAEKFNKEPKERPNDPIAKRGLLANMGKLMQAQEEVRAKKEARQGTQFALGGFTNANDDTLLYGDPFTYNDFLGSQGSISNPNDNSPSSDEDGFGASWLRYAPVVGSGISALASLRDKPNYAGANAVGNAVANMSPITATPIGNKLRYTPLDREFYLNRLDASAGATRRAVNNNAGGNRGTAMAGILAADYNYGQNLGNFARQAEEYNQAQKERVEGFNRQTDMFNSEAGLKAATATQGVKEAQLRGIIEEYNMRNAERNRVSANRSANLTGFFDNLGEVGREEFIRNQIQSNPAYNYNLTRSGKVKYKGNKKGGKNG